MERVQEEEEEKSFELWKISRASESRSQKIMIKHQQVHDWSGENVCSTKSLDVCFGKQNS